MDIVKERLLQFAKNQKIGMMKFYKKISVAQSNFSGEGANSALSTDKIIQILIDFPQLNPDWLLLGKGEMLRENTPEREGERPNQSPEMLEIIKKQQETINNLIEMLQSERSAHPEPGPRMCKNA